MPPSDPIRKLPHIRQSKRKTKNPANLLEGINCGVALLLNVIFCTYENILDDKVYVIRFYQLKRNNIWGHFQVVMQRWLLASEQQLASAIADISSINNCMCLAGCSNRSSCNVNGCVFAAQVDQLMYMALMTSCSLWNKA